MFRFSILFLIFSCFFAGEAQAQNIVGTVRDAESGLPLIGAHVLILPDGPGTTSDENGRFEIGDISPGEYRLKTSYVGYEADERTIRVGKRGFVLSIRLRSVALPGPEIVVSANRARERYSPVTYSNLTRRDIEERRTVQDFPVLLSDLPSTTFYSENGNGLGYNYLRIRGFDQRRLAIMVNGIPQNDPEDHNVYWLDFSDLLGSTEEIQVQRGAGSAFYGPPAIGGSINIVTGDFSNRKGISLSTGIGSYNTRRYAIAVGSGLVDNRYTFFGRLSRITSDGYRDNAWTEFNSYYLTATRYDETMSTRINVYGGPLADGLAYYGVPKFAIGDRSERRKNYSYWEADENGYTFKAERRPQEIENFSQPHFELLHEWRLNDNFTLNNAFFYVRGSGFFDYDATGWTDTSYFRMTNEYGFSGVQNPGRPIIRAYVDNNQFGWLPRLTYRHENGELTTGLELRYHRSLHWGRINWAENLPSELDPDRHYYEYKGGKDIASFYAREEYRLSERLNIMLNLQYVFNRYFLFDEKYVGTDMTVTYHFLNPRLGINFNISPEWNLYANVSRTSREPRLKTLYDAAESSGGAVPQFEMNERGGFDFTSPLVKPEALTNIELGAGYNAGPLQFIINGYWMDFDDEIIKSGQVDRFGQPITGNAERTLHAGLEGQVTWHFLPHFSLEANGMYSRNTLERYIVYIREKDPRTGEKRTIRRDLSGNRIAGFPDYLANARLSYRLGGFYASLGLKLVGPFYTDNFQDEFNKVTEYTVVDAAVGYRTPPVLGLRALTVRMTINNLLDRLYAASGEGNQYFVGAERNFFFDLKLDL